MAKSKEIELLTLKNRLHKLQSNGKNVDSPGVLRKLERRIKKIEQEQGEMQISPFNQEIIVTSCVKLSMRLKPTKLI